MKHIKKLLFMVLVASLAILPVSAWAVQSPPVLEVGENNTVQVYVLDGDSINSAQVDLKITNAQTGANYNGASFQFSREAEGNSAYATKTNNGVLTIAVSNGNHLLNGSTYKYLLGTLSINSNDPVQVTAEKAVSANSNQGISVLSRADGDDESLDLATVRLNAQDLPNGNTTNPGSNTTNPGSNTTNPGGNTTNPGGDIFITDPGTTNPGDGGNGGTGDGGNNGGNGGNPGSVTNLGSSGTSGQSQTGGLSQTGDNAMYIVAGCLVAIAVASLVMATLIFMRHKNRRDTYNK